MSDNQDEILDHLCCAHVRPIESDIEEWDIEEEDEVQMYGVYRCDGCGAYFGLLHRWTLKHGYAHNWYRFGMDEPTERHA